jgi:hypothetical protein
MPKSKVRKKVAYTPPSHDRTPVKIKGPTHPAYVAIMLGVGLLGLAWLITDYLARDAVPFLQTLGAANFLVGFGLIVIALLMSMRWR